MDRKGSAGAREGAQWCAAFAVPKQSQVSVVGGEGEETLGWIVVVMELEV